MHLRPKDAKQAPRIANGDIIAAFKYTQTLQWLAHIAPCVHRPANYMRSTDRLHG